MTFSQSLGHDAAQEMNCYLTPPIFHSGAWDGSAGVSWGADHFVAATDEENTLRVFPTDGTQAGTRLLDLNEWVAFPKRVKNGVAKEADLEGGGADWRGDLLDQLSCTES
jgi:hypothetical protein